MVRSKRTFVTSPDPYRRSRRAKDPESDVPHVRGDVSAIHGRRARYDSHSDVTRRPARARRYCDLPAARQVNRASGEVRVKRTARQVNVKRTAGQITAR